MLTTDFTKLLGVQHPVVLAGMGQASGAPLVAAVSNAGGLGVAGGNSYTPTMLREMIQEIKVCLLLMGLLSELTSVTRRILGILPYLSVSICYFHR